MLNLETKDVIEELSNWPSIFYKIQPSVYLEQLRAEEAVPEILIRVLTRKLCLKDTNLTMRTFWRQVARLGGFIGRKSDGDPRLADSLGRMAATFRYDLGNRKMWVTASSKEQGPKPSCPFTVNSGKLWSKTSPTCAFA